MAELNNTTQTQEPVYLNYGADQIDQQAFLDAAANNVQQYVNNQTWSAKRKQKFLNAYSDIMSKGIIGANNKTGQWAVDLNSNIDLESMDRKDQEMYHEAAYYILQQMKGITPKAKEEEKKKEENLTPYDLTAHTNGLQGFINNRYFGGRSMNIGGDKDDWNLLDERNSETGVRGTANRAKKLAEYLQGYSDSLEEGKYNFEGSPYKDLNDLKGRIANAVTQLNTGTDIDDADKEALNQIGLDWRDYFNDGSGDIADEEGHTYAELAKINQTAAEEKIKEEAVKAEANKRANAGVLSSIGGIHATDAMTNPQAYAEYLAGPQGLNAVGQEGFNIMNQRVQELLNRASTTGLSNNEKRQLGNFLYYIRQNNPNYQNSNISDEDWAELNLHKNLGSTNRAGYVRLPWEVGGRYTYADDKGNIYFLKPQNKAKIAGPAFNRSAAYDNYKNNFLKGTSAMNTQEREKYLKSSKDGLTSAEWEELASIGFDIASIVDPEMISSAGLALTGSGLRHHAAASQPGGMSTSDKWWQAADYGLSVLGSIPVLGDSALAWRALNNLKKAIVPLGVVMAGANVPQAAKAAYNKVVNGQDLTVQDWRAIGAVLTAAVGIGRGRQMSRRAEALRRTGGNTSKTTKEGVIKTSEGEIKVDEATAKQLKTQFEGADGATRTQKLRENAKVKEAARQQGIDLSKAEVQGHGRFKRSPISSTTSTSTTSGNRVATLRAMSEFNKNHGWLARKGLAEQDWVFRHTGGYESTPTSNWFKDAWNNSRKSKWDKFGNKNNPTTTTTNTSSQQQNQGINIPAGRFDDRSMAREEQLNRAVINRYKNILSGNVSNNPVKEGKFKFDNMNVEVKKAPTGTYDIFINGKRTDSIKDLTSTELKKHIASLVKEHRSSVNRGKSKSEKVSVKEMGKILQDLKKKGWLKQGGQINNFDLDKTISEFLNKQK